MHKNNDTILCICECKKCAKQIDILHAFFYYKSNGEGKKS